MDNGALLNEGGPWGGGGGGEEPKRKPWTPKRGPAGAGPSALDQLLNKGRARFAGGGGPPSFEISAAWRWGAIAVAALWLALTSVHTIGPQQRGVITRFGRYAGTLQPGLGFSLPWPVDVVRKIDVDNIHEVPIDNDPGQNGQNLMLTGDENLIDLAYTVRWNIRDPELYLFELQNPEGTIREVAESAMREAVARVTLNDAIGPQRSQIEARVAARTQEILDSYRAGVAVQGVAIRQADPPAEVMDAFKEVSAAQQTAQTYLNQARQYQMQIAAKASGEAGAFEKVYEQYRLSPEVTRRRMYYETMEKVLAKTDKTIVEAGGVTPYLPIQQAQKGPAK